MISILVTHEDQRVDRFDFETATVPIEIGRRSGNAVCIPNLSVSGRHAQLFESDGVLWIEDLGSTNGTWFNGHSVSRQKLDPDDELILGKVRLRVRRDMAAAVGTSTEPSLSTAAAHLSADSNPETATTTLVSGRGEPNRSGDGPVTLSKKADAAIGRPDDNARRGGNGSVPDESPGTTDSTVGSALIEIKNGAKEGQRLPIDKPVTTLGRPGIQIAAIMRKPDGYFLMHIESDDSVDRPTLNRDAIGDEPVMLSSGDRLNVAGIDVEFRIAS